MRAEWSEILKIQHDQVLYGLRVCLPARVTRVKAEAGTVDVEVGMLLPQVNPEDPPREVRELLDVPVAFPSSPTVEVAWAIQAGDPGLILVADHHLGNWLEVGRPIAPAVRSPHDLSNSVFLPGAVHPTSSRLPIPAEGVVVGVRDGEAIEIVGDEVRGGRGASEALATKADLEALIATFNAHTHVAPPGGGATAAPVPQASPSMGTSVLRGK